MNYKLNNLKFDFKAGLAVAAVMLPIGVAYSEMLGLPPESGIFTAVFALIGYFILGASNDLIISPDSAIAALIVSSLFALNIPDDLKFQFIAVTSIVTGVFFFAAGILRLGFISNFLSKPILVGYLNGVGVILIVSQLSNLTGVDIHNSNSIVGLFEFIGKIGMVSIPTLLIGIISLILLESLGVTSKRIPSQILLIIISVACVSLFNLSSYGIKFSPEIQSSIPSLIIPDADLFFNYYPTIIVDASAILFLSFTNTVLVGRSIVRDKRRYNPDKEFFAMGFADTVCGLFRGFPVAGSSSRTAINIASGAKTRGSMLFAAASMILVVFFLPTQFSLIPSAVFAAIIIDAAIGLFSFNELKEIRAFSKPEFNVSLICMFGVMIIGVLDGILIAIILSFINLIKRSSVPHEYELIYDPESRTVSEMTEQNQSGQRDDMLLYRFNSPMLFYNYDYFRKRLSKRITHKKNLRTVLIDVSPVTYIDITFRNELVDVISELKQKNVDTIFFSSSEVFQNRLEKRLKEKNLSTEIFFRDAFSAINFCGPMESEKVKI